MAETRFLFVFCYDIADDKKRRRLAKALEEEGVRVQGSVFEIETTAIKARQLVRRLEDYLDRMDSLRAYAVSSIGRRHSLSVGATPLLPKQGYVLL